MTLNRPKHLISWYGMPLQLARRLALLFCFTICLAHAQQPGSDGAMPAMDDSLAVMRWIRGKHIPALAVAYIQDGRLKEARVFGEIQPGVPAKQNSVFNVASVTKTVTTMVTLNLVSSGHWKLDEPVAHYFTDPDVRDDPRSQQLTTRDILTHQTGFPNWRSELPGGKLAFQFDPRTRHQYSGEGFEYLRHALENKFKRSLEQLADSIIFKPLGLTDTHYTWHTDYQQRFAYPFDAQGDPLEITKNTTPNAADLLKTTLPDYARFIVWMLDGGGLKSDLYAEMGSHQVVRKPDSYMGLGWVVYDPVGDGAFALSHGGHDPGVHTIAIMLPKSRKALVIFTNSDNGIQLYPELLSHYLGEQGRAIVAIETRKNR
nr:serine hydrolase domain-containing protein [uncultured Dyadobacter sp.]